jgi:crotonobetainyl-CoA:carnitine CoA-transferase CaiB-like acyl-CoA transferase
VAAISFDHPTRGRIRVIGELMRYSARRARRRGRSPLLGEHTDEILEELGFGSGEARRWIEDGVVAAWAPPVSTISP